MSAETDTVLKTLSWGEKKAKVESFISRCPDMKSRYVLKGAMICAYHYLAMKYFQYKHKKLTYVWFL